MARAAAVCVTADSDGYQLSQRYVGAAVAVEIGSRLTELERSSYGEDLTVLTGENKPRILLMGLRRCGALKETGVWLLRLLKRCIIFCCRSGKSSIQRVVFHKMSPHETLFLEGTNSLDIKYIANNSFVQFQIWDFPGDYDFKGGDDFALATTVALAYLQSCMLWLVQTTWSTADSS